MSTAYHLDSESQDTVVDMINWCLDCLEGSDEVDENDLDFEKRIRELADRMGLRDLKSGRKE